MFIDEEVLLLVHEDNGPLFIKEEQNRQDVRAVVILEILLSGFQNNCNHTRADSGTHERSLLQ